MGKVFLTIGLIGLCHAAYSATQHRSYMRLTEHDIDSTSSPAITSLPLDILIQTLVCLLFSCFGVISISAKFRPIKITSEWENKTWDNIANRTSFYSFNHRGKYLFSSDSNQFDQEPILEDFKISPKKTVVTKAALKQAPTPQTDSSNSDISGTDEYDSDEKTNRQNS